MKSININAALESAISRVDIQSQIQSYMDARAAAKPRGDELDVVVGAIITGWDGTRVLLSAEDTTALLALAQKARNALIASRMLPKPQQLLYRAVSTIPSL